MTALREVLDRSSDLSSAYSDSMSPLIARLASRFSQMKLKGEPIKCSCPASKGEIAELSTLLQFIEPSLSPDKLTKKDLSSYPSLQAFLNAHCHSSHYVFQIKKCLASACCYCTQYPVLSDPLIFEEMSFLPLPILDS